MNNELLGQDRSEFNVWFVPVALDDAGLSASQFRVYAHLARRTNKGRAWPGIDSIAAICDLHRETVIEAIKTLEARKMIEVRRQTGKGNIYILTRQSMWVVRKLPTDQSDKPTSRKGAPKPVGNGERKVIQEGNPVPPSPISKVVNSSKDIKVGKPTDPIAIRIAACVGRQPSTDWDVGEIKLFKTVARRSDFAAELPMMERYYAANRKKPDNNCRTNLERLLKHWSGEVDRARAYCDKHAPKAKAPKPARSVLTDVFDEPANEPPTDPLSVESLAFCESYERSQGKLPYGYKRDGDSIVFVGRNGASK